MPGVCCLLKETVCVCLCVYLCLSVSLLKRNVTLLIGCKMSAACFPQVPHIEGKQLKGKDAVGDSAFVRLKIANNLNMVL